MDEITTSQTNEILPTAYKDLVTMYRLHRDRVVQEDSLINYRMTWMLYSQTILFALWGGLFAAEVGFLGKSNIIEYLS